MTYISSLGANSKTTILALEPGKLSQEFEAAATIKKGQPLQLSANGTVILWTQAAGLNKLVGYAYSDAAIGDLVTAFTRGFMIIYALSFAAVSAGPVGYKSYSTTDLADDETTFGDDMAGTSGFSVYTNTTLSGSDDAENAEETNGWSLDQVTKAGQVIRVLLKD